jgi:nucleotidyltransferase substrate binding protein (TIGR01987 family)
MKLDLSALAKAVISLKRALDERKKLPDDEYIRDACIQRFEYTYELSWKMLKRYLEMTVPTPEEIDAMSFASLIRTGSEQGLLLSDFSVWKQYREKRSITSHTYDQEKAIEILKQIPSFLKDAEYLLHKLNERAGTQ